MTENQGRQDRSIGWIRERRERVVKMGLLAAGCYHRWVGTTEAGRHKGALPYVEGIQDGSCQASCPNSIWEL